MIQFQALYLNLCRGIFQIVRRTRIDLVFQEPVNSVVVARRKHMNAQGFICFFRVPDNNCIIRHFCTRNRFRKLAVKTGQAAYSFMLF